MSVKIGSARIDENGNTHGGKAGDQTGKEVSTQSWYNHSKGWRVFRAKDPAVAEKIAKCMQAACDNKHIGYDQNQRDTLYNDAKQYGFDVSKVTKDVETDCSALVRVCINYAGVTVGNFRTTDEASKLLKTGAFVELTGSKYTDQSTYLGRGDILCTRSQGHTVVVLSNGSKYEGTIQGSGSSSPTPTITSHEYVLGDRIVKYGCEGADVKVMQEMLLKLGYDLGKWGCDGDFGDCTELALIKFQKDSGIEADGECGPITIDAFDKAIAKLDQPVTVTTGTVKIEGGNCYVRTEPNTDGKKLGVAHKGDTLPYAGEVSSAGWLKVIYNNQPAWVSGKYGSLVK